jgi:HEAT repeat protein
MAALAPLIRDPEVGGDAAQALERWAGPSDVQTLVQGLDSNEVRVRMFLLRALGRLKAEEAIPALVEHMTVPEDRGEASRALQAIGPKAAPEVQKLLTSDDRDVRREATNLLRQFGGNDPGTRLSLALASLNSPDNVERDRALQDLGRSPAVEASRDEVLAAVLPLLKAPEPSTRRWALKVVETWGAAEQVPALVDALDDTDRNVKVMAVAALGKIPDQRSALALAGLLETAEVRREATNALVAMKPRDKEVEAEVIKALGSPDAATRQSACQVLRVIGTAASIPALRRATRGREAERRLRRPGRAHRNRLIGKPRHFGREAEVHQGDDPAQEELRPARPFRTRPLAERHPARARAWGQR